MPETRSSLIHRMSNGADEATWREFVEIYYPLIVRTVRNSGIPETDVDDVVQEVLMQLLRSFPRFEYQRTKGGFRCWLRRVTINKIHDARRRQSGTLLLANPAEVPAPLAEEEEWTREFRSRLLRYGIDTLEARFGKQGRRKKTWRCFAEHGINRRKAADVARELNVSENAVYVNCSRVLPMLREFCMRYGEELAGGEE